MKNMNRKSNTPAALTIGQLAKRWGVSTKRIHQLTADRLLPGAFRIPSAGQFGNTIKIPVYIIEKAEADWALAPTLSPAQRKTRARKKACPDLKHFPELAVSHEDDVGFPEDERH